MPTEADYTDPDVQQAIEAHGWMIWPPIPYSYDTIVKNLPTPAPSPPTWQNLLGTDDQARDVLARVIYGFRLSVLFGFSLTIVSSVVGIAAGAVQGYYGGADRSAVPALHRNLERHAAALSADHPGQHHHAGLLGAADLPAAVLAG